MFDGLSNRDQLRVLIIGEFGPGKLGLYYQRAFQKMRIRCDTFDCDPTNLLPGSMRAYRAVRRVLRIGLWRLLEHRCLEQAKSGYDLILVLKAPFLSPPCIRNLRSITQKVIMYYPDSPWDPYTQRLNVLDVLRACDLTLIWSRDLVQRLSTEGVRADYLPFAYDPEDYSPPTREMDREPRAVFIGQVYPKRVEWLRALEGLPVEIVGTDWREEWFGKGSSIRVIREHRMGKACGETYGRHVVALNVLDDKNSGGHNMRTYEIPATGTMMVGSSCRDCERLFPHRVGSLIASDPTEFRREVAWALSNARDASLIAEEGLRIASPFTYQKNAEAIINLL